MQTLHTAEQQLFLSQLSEEGYQVPSHQVADMPIRSRYMLMHWASLTYRKRFLCNKKQSDCHLARLFTILIPTIPERRKVIQPLLEELDRQQIPFLTCDTLIESTGNKRNYLIEKVTTPYLAFIDDDDWIHRDYGEIVQGYLDRFEGSGKFSDASVDIVAFSVLYFQNQLPPRTIKMGSTHFNWQIRGPILRRPVMPWCILKTDFVQPIPFPDLYWGEDRIWSEQVMTRRPPIMTIPKHLYGYEFLEADSKTNQDRYIQAFYDYQNLR